jgi:hypothetical protein
MEVLGVIILKPAAMRRSCSLWVCVLVLAQPTARVRSAPGTDKTKSGEYVFH